VVVILTIGLIIMGVITPFMVLYAVYMGLKWNINIQKGEPIEPPNVEIPNPFKDAAEKNQTAIQNEIMKEWLYGADEQK
jgi:hypothetical protein